MAASVAVFIQCVILIAIGQAAISAPLPPASAASANQSAHPLLQNEPGAWVIELSSRGGEAGQGGGGGTITSQGEAMSSRGPIRPTSTGACKTMLTETDLVTIKKALAAAEPAQWKATYPPPEGDNGCCDRFRHELAFYRRNADGTIQKTTALWYTGNAHVSPADLAALEQAAFATLDKVHQQCKQMEAVRDSLRQIASGKSNPAPLVVTYDDRHALHGGMALTIRGTGQVEQTGARQETGMSRRVSRKELIQLIRRLITQRAWEQRTSDHPALPDESRATLTIGYGDVSMQIWEWFNDLEQNRRIGDIGGFMKQIAGARDHQQSIDRGKGPK